MILTYRYGLRPPKNWGEDCEAEMRRQNTLWNTLVEIFRHDREQFEAIMRSHPAVAPIAEAVDELNEKIDALYAERKKKRSDARGKIATPEEDKAIADLVELRASFFPGLKEARKQAQKQFKQKLKALDEEHKNSAKRARQCSGCYWGNYNAVIENYNTARTRALKEGATLRFHSWIEATGRLTVQPQRGIDGELGATVEEVIRGKSRVVKILDAVPGVSSKSHQKILAMIAHTHGGERRWVSWPLNLHRPLPPDARIKRVTVKRVKWAKHERWTVNFMLKIPDVEIKHKSIHAVGVNLNWRHTRDGLRVASWEGSDGWCGTLEIPHRILSRFNELRSLASRLDELCSAAAAVVARLPDGGPIGAQVSAVKRAKHVTPRLIQSLLIAWREYPDWQPSRRALLVRPRDKRPGEVGPPFAIWNGSVHHRDNICTVWEWLTNSRLKAIAQRRELYIQFARKLARNYAIIAIDDIPLAKMANKAGMGQDLHETSRRNRQIASLYELQQWLERQAHKTGGRVERYKIKSTQICHRCGEKMDASDDFVTLSCGGCSLVIDRDTNAARNLLAVATGERDLKPSRVSEDKTKGYTGNWQKRRIHAQSGMGEQP